MAITVQYGPIGQALGLAQTAGTGQGRADQAARDMEALRIQNQMQAQMDSQNNQQIQMAMAQQELQARVAQQQQQDQQNNVYRNAQLQMQQQGLAMQGENLKSQQQAKTDENQTRADVAQALQDKRDQETQAAKVKADALAALSPAERKLAQFPALASQQLNANQTAHDQFLRDQMEHETLKQSAIETHAEYLKALGLKPDVLNGVTPEAIADQQKAAKKASDDAMTAYQTHAKSLNTSGETTAEPTPGTATTPVNNANVPVGPSPHGPGGRKQMSDGSIWTWNGITWTKG